VQNRKHDGEDAYLRQHPAQHRAAPMDSRIHNSSGFSHIAPRKIQVFSVKPFLFMAAQKKKAPNGNSEPVSADSGSDPWGFSRASYIHPGAPGCNYLFSARVSGKPSCSIKSVSLCRSSPTF
jgi:hypothetical protein